MKKRIAQFLLALCLMLPLLIVNAGAAEKAANEELEKLTYTLVNITWSYDTATKRMTISGEGIMGPMPYQLAEYKSEIESVVVSPGVTSVGDHGATVYNTFKNCTALADVSLPDSVAAIGHNAFKGCTALTKINIPSAVKFIGYDAFQGTKITEANIPAGVVEIGDRAFADCKQLSTVAIPSSVLRIGNDAFSGCSSLTSINLPAGVILAGHAFQGCTSLTEVTIPKNCAISPQDPFYMCTGLENAIIGENVYVMGNSIFSGCNNLKTITIPESIFNLTCLNGCENLETVNYGGSEFQWLSRFPKDWQQSLGTGKNIDVHCALTDLPKGSVPGKNGAGIWEYNPDSNILGILVTDYAEEGYMILPFEIGWTSDGSPMPWAEYLTKDPIITIYEKDASFKLVSGVFPAGTIIHGSNSVNAQYPKDITVHTFVHRDTFSNQHVDTDDTSPRAGCPVTSMFYMCSYVDCPLYSDSPGEIVAEHNPIEEIHEYPDSCRKNGLAFGIRCGTCKTILVEPLETPAYSHVWENETSTITKYPTCEEKGVRVYQTKCENCGYISETRTVDISALGHSWGSAVEMETTAPTCTQTGIKTITQHCTRANCDKVYTQTKDISANGHSEVPVPGKDATCTETGLTEGLMCSVCDAVIKAQEEIPVTEHDWSEEISEVTAEPTCGKSGTTTYTKTCQVCGDVSTRTETLPATGKHDYQIDREDIHLAATCVTEGSKTVYYECANCPATKEERSVTIPRTDHTEEDIPYMPPTCGTPGLQGGKQCSYCKIILEEGTEIPATGNHTRGQKLGEHIEISPTCTTSGILVEMYQCSVCQQEFEAKSPIPATGNHVFAQEILTGQKAATCTEDGYAEFTQTCINCPMTKTRRETMAAPGHVTGEIPGQAPTCTTPGSTAGKRCEVCQEILEQPQRIDPPGHKEVDIPEVPATCTAPGSTAGKRCTVCQEILEQPQRIDPLNHTEVDIPEVPATCTTPGKTAGKRCTVCDTITVPPQETALLDHSWGTETSAVTTDPTCTQPGIRTYTRKCTVCGKEETWTEEEAAKGHTEEVIPAVSPTCTTDGSTEGKKCSVCGEVLEAPQTIPAAHTDVELIPGKDATCTEEGLTEGSRCNACGTPLVEQKAISALGHDWVVSGSGTETVTKEPTCTEDGSKEVAGSVCSRCGAVSDAVITVVIPANGHSWGEETSEITAAATCTEEGIRTYTRQCTAAGCGEVKTRAETIPAAGHTYGQWSTTQEPTATQPGARERVCSVCGDKETETIPATGGGNTQPDAPQVYTITFDPNGGTGGTTRTTSTDGRLSSLPGGPTRSGYTFSGWYTAVSGGEAVTTSTVFQNNATVYARWSEQPAAPSGERYPIYIPGRVSGGSVDTSHSYAAAGTRVTIELNPRSGYELDWLEAVDLSTGRDLRLTRLYDDEYTFIMPASAVEVDLAFAGRYWYNGNSGSGGIVWSVPEQPPASLKPINWYFRDGQIWHVTDGLVPYNTPLTRDMLISVLYNLDDTSTGEQVVWAAAEGIVPSVYPSGLWGMDKNISREQTAMIFYCYAGHKGLDLSPAANLTIYRDYSQVRTIARQSLSWAQATGLIPAPLANRLSPRDTLSCGEANAILSRFVSTIARTS